MIIKVRLGVAAKIIFRLSTASTLGIYATFSFPNILITCCKNECFHHSKGKVFTWQRHSNNNCIITVAQLFSSSNQTFSEQSVLIIVELRCLHTRELCDQGRTNTLKCFKCYVNTVTDYLTGHSGSDWARYLMMWLVLFPC